MLIAMASAGAPASAQSSDADPHLRAQLERVARLRIFFAHQSVGMNVLDGAKALAAAEGVPLRIEEVPTAQRVPDATLGHMFVPENGKPLEKLDNFAHAMAPPDAKLDAAMVKFCFLDFTPKTDPKALFEHYRSTIDALRARNPGTVFVHITVPLTTVQKGLKAWLKCMLGRAPYGAIENLRREEYNTLLRGTYQGREPLFDLARMESTAPDGRSVTTEWNGRAVPALESTYTDDGSHLNGTGRLRAARELVRVLAAIPRRNSR